MLDSSVTPLFESCDYDAFAKHVGKYRHDLLNRQGNVQLGCNIISRFVARLPNSPALPADSVQEAADLSNSVVEQCHTTTEAVREVLWFPKAEDLAEADDETHARFSAVQSRWEPYDGQAWESLMLTLDESVEPHLAALERQLAQLSEILQTLVAASTDDDDAASMLEPVTKELVSALDAFQLFKDLMNLQKLIYIPQENRWESAG